MPESEAAASREKGPLKDTRTVLPGAELRRVDREKGVIELPTGAKIGVAVNEQGDNGGPLTRRTIGEVLLGEPLTVRIAMVAQAERSLGFENDELLGTSSSAEAGDLKLKRRDLRDEFYIPNREQRSAIPILSPEQEDQRDSLSQEISALGRAINEAEEAPRAQFAESLRGHGVDPAKVNGIEVTALATADFSR